MQLCAPKVVASAVRMVMRMLRILPQVLLLLKVPIVLVGFCGLDISVLRLDFMNKVPVCSFSDAKIRHLFGAMGNNGK